MARAADDAAGTPGDALVSRATRREVRALLSWSREEGVIRAIALYPALCTAFTLVAYRVNSLLISPITEPPPYGDYILQSSPGWPHFVVPPVIYWFGIVPVVFVTVLWVLDRPAEHLPDATVLVIMLILDAVMTFELSTAFLDLEEWPHDLWIAAVVMAVCAVVVMVVATRRRRRRRREARS